MKQEVANVIIGALLVIFLFGILTHVSQTGGSAATATIELSVLCLEKWTCTPFSECINGIQTRTCVDVNSCGTTFLKPATEQLCLVSPPRRGGGFPLPPPDEPLIDEPLIEAIQPDPGERLDQDQIREINESLDIEVIAVSAVALEVVELEAIEQEADPFAAEELRLVSPITPLIALRLNISNKGNRSIRDLSFIIKDKETEFSHPVYISKVVPFPENLQGVVWPSREGINGYLQHSVLLDSTFFDEIKPGEIVTRDVRMRTGITLTDQKQLTASHYSFDSKIGENDLSVPLNIPSYGSTVHHLPQTSQFDIYIVASGEQISQVGNLLTGAAILPFSSLNPEADVYLDISVNRGSREGYNPTLSIRGLWESLKKGPSSVYAEEYGPYALLHGEKFLFAQKMNYNASELEGNSLLVALNLVRDTQSLHKDTRELIVS